VILLEKSKFHAIITLIIIINKAIEFAYVKEGLTTHLPTDCKHKNLTEGGAGNYRTIVSVKHEKYIPFRSIISSLGHCVLDFSSFSSS
jgi:hypothetical protein